MVYTALVTLSIIYFKTRCQASGKTLLVPLELLLVQCLRAKKSILSQSPVFDLKSPIIIFQWPQWRFNTKDYDEPFISI